MADDDFMNLKFEALDALEQNVEQINVNNTDNETTATDTETDDIDEIYLDSEFREMDETTINEWKHNKDPSSFESDYFHTTSLEKMRKKYFEEVKEYKPNQLEIINATLLNFDCFVQMATGYGKSLCFQLPAMVEVAKITIVISSLKSFLSLIGGFLPVVSILIHETNKKFTTI